MRIAAFTLVFSVFILFGCIGLPEQDSCEDLYGTYVGTITGSPLSGELTIYVSTNYDDVADLTGTWTASSGLTGSINRADLNCTTGKVDYEYGLNLAGPFDVVCPNGDVNSTGCYDTGATLGRFKGTITANGGSGTWQANSGAADYLGVVGSGTWSVTRQ